MQLKWTALIKGGGCEVSGNERLLLEDILYQKCPAVPGEESQSVLLSVADSSRLRCGGEKTHLEIICCSTKACIRDAVIR